MERGMRALKRVCVEVGMVAMALGMALAGCSTTSEKPSGGKGERGKGTSASPTPVPGTDVALADGIVYRDGKPSFITGVWAGHSVTYLLPKYKEGIDPDLPMYRCPCDQSVAEHVGFSSTHPAVPIRATLERMVPEAIRRPQDKREEAYRTFIEGMGDMPLAMDLAGISTFSKTTVLAPDMYQNNPGWHSFIPLCLENPKAWAIFEDYLRDGVRKTLDAGGRPYVYELFNEPAYNCRCAWNRRTFRERMEKRYGTMEAANAQWGTSFASFDEVEAVTAFREHPGLWVDWLKFIGDRYCEILLKAKAVIESVDDRRPIAFMEQPAVSMVYIRTNGIDSYKVAQVMDAVGMEGGVGFGSFKTQESENAMETVIVNSSVLSHQLHLDMARSFGKPVLNTEFYCGRFHDGVRFPSRRSDLTTGLWVELVHGVSADYFYNWGRRWWEWKNAAGAKKSGREAKYKAFSLLNTYDYPPDSLYGIRDFEQEMDLLGDIALPNPRIRGDVAMLVSNPTSRMMMQKWSYTASGAKNPYELRIRDWYGELVLSHYALDMLYEEDLTPSRLNQYRAVVVPRTEFVYVGTAEALNTYAANGGNVIAERGSFAKNEYGHPLKATVRAEWIDEDLDGNSLHSALVQALSEAGVKPTLGLIAADGATEPLTVEAHVIARPEHTLVFLVNWSNRSRLAELHLAPRFAAEEQKILDPIANKLYLHDGNNVWTADEIAKGLPVALPAQTRKILLLNRADWPHPLTSVDCDDARREYAEALAVDERELAMVDVEFRAERKAKEDLVVDFGGPRTADGRYAPDAATAALYHFEDSLDAQPQAGTAKVTGQPAFTDGKFGSRALHVGQDMQILCDLPSKFSKDHGTVEAWVKPDWPPNDGKRHTVVTIRGDGSWNQNAIGLYKNLNYEFTFFVFDREKKSHTVSVPITIFKQKTWVHLAATWDVSSGVKLYVDGKLAKEKATTWQMDPLNRMYIGTSHDGDRAWDGVIDELRISNTIRRPLPATP